MATDIEDPAFEASEVPP